MPFNKILPVSIFACLTANLATAQSAATNSVTPTPDKSGYHLFHPTPASLMRELSTDRPDKTESPYTLDAGHFQLEMDLISYTRDHDQANGADTRVDGFAIAPVNLKVGLFNDVDLQLVIESYNYVRTVDRVAATTEKQSGFGDVTVRLKKNFWGNDGGKTAFAMMPFLKLPANQDGLGNKYTEGGIIFPLAVDLPMGFGMGLMTEFDFLHDEAGSGYHASFINSVTFSRDIVGNLGGYVEFFSEVSGERGVPWVGTVDFGLTYGINENVQLDAGINLGVTKSADDLNPFIGLSVRF